MPAGAGSALAGQLPPPGRGCGAAAGPGAAERRSPAHLRPENQRGKSCWREPSSSSGAAARKSERPAAVLRCREEFRGTWL